MSDTTPPDASSEDFEVLKEVEGELERLVHHPRTETARLKQVAADGEHGSTPFIELVLVARWIVPLVAVFIGIALLIYFKA